MLRSIPRVSHRPYGPLASKRVPNGGGPGATKEMSNGAFDELILRKDGLRDTEIHTEYI